jgi:hypothetical protein
MLAAADLHKYLCFPHAAKHVGRGGRGMTTTGQRKPNVSFNIEFFTHRMEPEKSAKFASDYAERFIVTPPAEAGPEAPARLRGCIMLPPSTEDL